MSHTDKTDKPRHNGQIIKTGQNNEQKSNWVLNKHNSCFIFLLKAEQDEDFPIPESEEESYSNYDQGLLNNDEKTKAFTEDSRVMEGMN